VPLSNPSDLALGPACRRSVRFGRAERSEDRFPAGAWILGALFAAWAPRPRAAPFDVARDPSSSCSMPAHYQTFAVIWYSGNPKVLPLRSPEILMPRSCDVDAGMPEHIAANRRPGMATYWLSPLRQRSQYRCSSTFRGLSEFPGIVSRGGMTPSGSSGHGRSRSQPSIGARPSNNAAVRSYVLQTEHTQFDGRCFFFSQTAVRDGAHHTAKHVPLRDPIGPSDSTTVPSF